MKFSVLNLYVKIGCWMLLNLALLGVLCAVLAAYALFGGKYDGVVSASLFSARSDSTLRVISANLQYCPVLEWKGLLEEHIKRLPVRFHIQTLDTESIRSPEIPDSLVARAARLPRAPYSFCPGPEVMFWDPLGGTLFANPAENVEYGLPPVPPAIFMHTSSPSTYWLGRIMYVPDHNRQVHTLLVAMASDRIDGHGFFFDVNVILLVVFGALGVSFLWWLPFVRHLSQPLRRMARCAETLEASNFASVDETLLEDRDFSGRRKDEIGRLGHALLSMMQRCSRMVTGQSQFIRHVAHELNTPLAKAQMGLGVLECRLEGEDRARVTQVLTHIKRLSVLTEEVLTYLQAKASMGSPQKEDIDLCPFLSTLVQSEAPGADVHVEVEHGLHLWCGRLFLQRIVINLLRNAQAYAGDGPVIVRALSLPERGETGIFVEDCGPGVPEEELPLLLEPFFRGRNAASFSGGTGLGLAIVRYCTEACGGRIEYGNRAEKGFAVRLYFPAV
ncbi:HAMP domain-containing sensor histidine kinase [uncultured Mailhella sp.]|uniref:sensor histidine kinase n=1 Tax=uncultured Mailhella sp. TaxID=1981031 RepID=UPI00261874A7|nr:HAMP domain-containing sensor histidine kinase [uncultured Mailhella sp.]